MSGLWFEEFKEGQVFDHSVSRTITEADNMFPRPVFHGDTIRVRTTIVGKRESKSRPDNGIVVFLHEAFNQRAELVANCTRTGLMHKRPVSTTARS